MSDQQSRDIAATNAAANQTNLAATQLVQPQISSTELPTAATPAATVATTSNATTPASSVTGIPSASRLKAPKSYGGSTGSVSKIGRPCCNAAPKAGPPPRETSNMSRESDDNLSSIASNYTDHGAVLTADTEQFIIGQKVWVGGIRPGQIAYIGETHFAPGEWAGIVLDELNGKNDGCVAGKRYFQCEPKRGIFSRLTRLTLFPLAGAYASTASPTSKTSPELSRTVSPTASVRSSYLRSPGGKNGLTVGDRVIVSSGFGSRPGLLRYLGETQFASGNWCGVELDEASGKNDGSVDGIRYFECKPKYGVFVPIAKVSLSPSTKKTRLSRTGSRESLTSIGTMNSIATTNTSRMRMNAQRKSSLIKPVSTPKSQYTMQDLLREKHNHIEQLMIERDMDREDAQNQALNFQKNISELKSRITHLERLLEDERKKSEDLQFSIDEATFCGEELNAQTQVYKEKIQELEQEISQKSVKDLQSQDNEVSKVSSNSPDADRAPDDYHKQLLEQVASYEERCTDSLEEKQRLLENINYLQKQNESLQKELLEKDQSLEKFSLSESGIDNLRKELELLKEENEKEREKLNALFEVKLEEKQENLLAVKDELTDLKNTLDRVVSEKTNADDECEILRTECRARDEQLHYLNEVIVKLKAEFSMKDSESKTLDEMLNSQKLNNASNQSELNDKENEIAQLKQEFMALHESKCMQESKWKSAAEEVEKLRAIQKEFEEKLSNLQNTDEQKSNAMHSFEELMNELKLQLTASNAENENNKKLMQELKQINSQLLESDDITKKYCEDIMQQHAAALNELGLTKESLAKLQQDYNNLQEETTQSLEARAQELTTLSMEAKKLHEQTKAATEASDESIKQLNLTISNLESANQKLQEELKISELNLHTNMESQTKLEQNLQQESTKLTETAKKLELTNNMLETLTKEHELMVTKSKELTEQLTQKQQSFDKQELELGDMLRKNEALNTKCETISSQNETLQQDLLLARSTVSTAQESIQKLNNELQLQQSTYYDLQSSTNEERLKLESQIEELQQKILNITKDSSEQNALLQKTKEELTNKKTLLTEMEEKLIKNELNISDAARQQEHLQKKYNDLVAQNESLQKDLTTLRTTSTDSNTELLKLSRDLAEKQKTYEELVDKSNDERSTLMNQLQASQQRVDVLCSQVETLTQELKINGEESFQRFETIKLEQEKCSKMELELHNLNRKLECLVEKDALLENQKEELEKELTALRAVSTNSNTELLKLTEESSNLKKSLQELTDNTSAERLQLESKLQEVTQQLLSSQKQAEELRKEVQNLMEAQSLQITELERSKAELHENVSKELEELKTKQQSERQTLIDTFENQLKLAEKTKISLDEAIISLQNQIKLLQDELLKSQLDFKSKEENLKKELNSLKQENQQLVKSLKEAEAKETKLQESTEIEKAELSQKLRDAENALKENQQKVESMQIELDQLSIIKSSGEVGLSNLEIKVNSLQNALDLLNTDLGHRIKINEEDKQKIAELKSLLEKLQTSNANISATNAELSAALHVLEQEKCETAHIFELFEMESDQTTDKLIEKLSKLKYELEAANKQIISKDEDLKKQENSIAAVTADLQTHQKSLAEIQQNFEALQKQLHESQQANKKLEKSVAVFQEQSTQQKSDIEYQVTEYKSVIDEMDASMSEKSKKLELALKQVAELKQQHDSLKEQETKAQTEYENLLKKFKNLELEKTREIVELQKKISELQNSENILLQNGNDVNGQGDSTAQINFLNSIIADMRKKNDELIARIEALETLPTDFTKPHAFDSISKRKPAPRLFCDICDEFDKHETEDCPLQASDDISPPPELADKKERKLPEPRKYCETCEMFGHDATECQNDECF